MSDPTASIVVPSRGGRSRLPLLFSALAGQSTTDFEVIVVCDGDIDDSASLIASWADRIPVRAIVFDENRGRSAALNAGFAAASGRVLIRCDDDLEPGPDFVANHISYHGGDPVGVVGMCPDVDSGTPYARVYGNAASERTQAHWLELGPDETWRCWSANVSCTRATFDRVGHYDDRYRKYGWEDVDWGYRVHEAGIPVVIGDDLTALHYGPARTAAERAAKAFLAGESRATFERIHGPLSTGRPRPGRGLWGALVWLASRPLANENGARALGAAADLAATILPGRAATHAVAGAVEAAGYRGATKALHQRLRRSR